MTLERRKDKDVELEDTNLGYIDEYNQLRAEIRMSVDHGSKSLQIIMALGAAAVGFGSKFPDLLIVSSLIVFYIWYDEIRHLRAVHRIASYLEVCVEPHIVGLNWETINQYHSFIPSFANRIIANAPFPTIAFVLAFYGIYLKKWPYWIGVLVIGIGIYLFIISYRTAKNGRNKEREEWKRILMQLTSKSDAMPKQSIKVQNADGVDRGYPSC